MLLDFKDNDVLNEINMNTMVRARFLFLYFGEASDARAFREITFLKNHMGNLLWDLETNFTG